MNKILKLVCMFIKIDEEYSLFYENKIIFENRPNLNNKVRVLSNINKLMEYLESYKKELEKY